MFTGIVEAMGSLVRKEVSGTNVEFWFTSSFTQELKVDQFSEEPISPDFVHTSRFILIDKKMQVRGYYNGLDSASMLKLAKDVGYLMLEKDKTKKSKVFQDIIDLSWLWLVIALMVSSFVYYFTKTRLKN